MRIRSCVGFAVALLAVLTWATSAGAQTSDPPIGPFVVDVRGSLAPYGQNELLAADLGLQASDLPARGLGLDVGGHWYFVRWRAITFGVGGSFHLSQAEQQTQGDPMLGTIDGPVVRSQLKGFMPQLSFNFGTGLGWSYVSGGLSPATLGVAVNGEDRHTRSTKTINYGGGARWFAKPHVAFTFDLRFYAMNPLAAEGTLPGTPRMTLMVISAGASFK